MFSAFIKDIESRPESSVWGSRLPFNTLCAEYLNESGGWVHSVAFSCSGNALAFAGWWEYSFFASKMIRSR